MKYPIDNRANLKKKRLSIMRVALLSTLLGCILQGALACTLPGALQFTSQVYVYLMNADNSNTEQTRVISVPEQAIDPPLAKNVNSPPSMVGESGEMCLKSDGSITVNKSNNRRFNSIMSWLSPSTKQQPGGLTGITNMGDLDEDNVSDLAVGAYLEDEKRGKLYLVFLNSDKSLKGTVEINVSQLGLDANDQFGFRLSRLGDMNGDNVPELAVGAFGDDDGGSNCGAVYILFLTNGSTTGSPSSSSPSWSISSFHKISAVSGMSGALDNGDFFGMGVVIGGDLDNDGIVDLLVGANHDFDGGSYSSGAVYVILLNAHGGVKQHEKINTFNLVTKPLSSHNIMGGLESTLAACPPGGAGDNRTIDVDSKNTSTGGSLYIYEITLDCIPPNGCLSQPESCGPTERCQDTLTGYDCLPCPPRYRADAWGQTCEAACAQPGGLQFMSQETKLISPNPIPRGQFGSSSASLGDLNGDGVTDIAVSAWTEPGGGTYRGAVYVYLMNADNTVKEQRRISSAHGEGMQSPIANYDMFGASMTGTGDVDGDGVGDLVVSTFSNSDALYVVCLNSDGSVKSDTKLDTMFWLNPTSKQGLLGLTTMGDLDGDNVPDLAVGAYMEDGKRGKLYLVFLNPDGSLKGTVEIDVSQLGLDASDQFGFRLTRLGDMNGDNVPELAVGAFGDDDGGTNRGAVYIMFLANNATGTGSWGLSSYRKISSMAGMFFSGVLDDGDGFGMGISAGGDMDNNGVVDLLVGARGDSDAGASYAGAVYVILLNENGGVKRHEKISHSKLVTAPLDAYDQMGQFITLISSRDEDQIGVTKLAVSANGDDEGGNGAGAVYILDISFDCVVDNECKDQRDTCGPTEWCQDGVMPAFNCLPCPAGYQADALGLACEPDAEECAQDLDGCDFNHYCSNTEAGSFECIKCPTGYVASSGAGTSCDDDADECALDLDDCDLNHFCSNTVGSFECLRCPTGYVASGDGTSCDDAILPDFSWDTLPVYFHSAVGSGPWTAEQADAIARYPLATFEKNMGFFGNRDGFTEVNGPAACRQINAASQGTTTTLYYLNSVVDWWHFSLTLQMSVNPDWRLKDENGVDITLFSTRRWLFNFGVPEMREAWVTDVMDAIDAGCGGVFIDKANNIEQFHGWTMSPTQSAAFQEAHMETLDELDERLALKKAFAIANNNGAATEYRVMMMIEDFAGTENCIERLRTVVSRGLGVQVHAGNYPSKERNQCVSGDINTMAAFLISMGEHCYYHCSPTWQSNEEWPAVSDWWLDWLPEYDHPIGTPLADGVKETDGVWRRSFSLGTTAEFDPATGVGTITWGDNPTVPHVGESASAILGAMGCRWQTME